MQTYTVRFYDEFEHLMSACTVQAPGEITAIKDAATETKTRLSVVGRIEIERLNARENVELPGEDTANPPAYRENTKPCGCAGNLPVGVHSVNCPKL